MNPNVSVIMPTYNRANIIGRAMKSVLNQTYREFELLIINDGSTDHTDMIIDEIADERIKYIVLPRNYGCSHARNVGISKAKGRYLAFLDSDNEWERDHLERRIAALSDMGENAMVFGSMYFDSAELGRFPDTDAVLLRDRDRLQSLMLMSNQIDTNTVVLTKRAWMLVGEFDENMTALEDWDFFFRVIRNPEIDIVYDENLTVHHYLSPDSLSRNKGKYFQNRIRIYAKNEMSMTEEEWDGIPNYDMACLSDTTNEEWRTIAQAIGETEPDAFRQYMVWMLKKQNAAWSRAETGWHNTCEYLNIYEQIINAENSLMQRGLFKISIYGYGKFGKILYRQLRGSSIEVIKIYDQRFRGENGQKKNSKDVACARDIDGIIVTILEGGNKIIEDLGNETEIPLYWLKELAVKDQL